MELLCATAVLGMVASVTFLRANFHAQLQQAECAYRLEEVTLAFRQFANDNRNLFPMNVSVQLEGAREFSESGDIASIFRSLSYYQPSAAYLVCPSDSRPSAPAMFRVTPDRISYFINTSATDAKPASVLLGDRDLAQGGDRREGTALLTGIQVLDGGGRALAWGGKLHRGAGNVALANGAVQSLSSLELNMSLGTSLEPVRLLFPD